MKSKIRRSLAVILSIIMLCMIIFPSFAAQAGTVIYKYGDVDLDDAVTVTDATRIQQKLSKLTELSDLQCILADVNLSDDVDISDATIIQQKLAKLISEFPSGEFYTAEEETKDWRLSTISYEIFVRSFYDTNNDGIGDFRGVAEKVDYLKSLNVGCVWLMPIYPTDSYHGYDVKNYTATNTQYGSLDDFDYMLETLHNNGIKVIIDFVPNHSSVNHPWFQSAISDSNSKYKDYYFISTQKGSSGSWHYRNGKYYRGDFSSTMPDLNYNNEAVWDEMKSAAGFWLDRGVDGFRLDAVMHLDDNKKVNHAFLQDFEVFVKSKNSDAYVVGEVWSSQSTIKPYYKDIDSCFNFDYASTILRFAALNRSDIVYSMNDANRAYTASANNSPIKDSLNTIDSVFITNHDQTRTASMLENDSQTKLAAAVLMTSKGMPFIYYGEELGQKSNDWDNNRREPLDWYKSAKGTGMTDSNKWGIRPMFTIANDGISLEEEASDQNSIYNYYVKLTEIRKENDIFFDGTYTSIDSSSDFYEYTVTDENTNYGMYVAHNRSNSSATFTASQAFTDLLSGKTYSAGQKVTVQPCASVIVRYSGNKPKYDPLT